MYPPIVKEIYSKDGVLHFRRWLLFYLPYFRIYFHHILESDKDKHMHDHPWHFISIIVSGGYEEKSFNGKEIKKNTYKPFSFVFHKRKDGHQIKLLKPTKTIVIAFGKKTDWGYLLENNKWINHIEYRKNKREGLY